MKIEALAGSTSGATVVIFMAGEGSTKDES